MTLPCLSPIPAFYNVRWRKRLKCGVSFTFTQPSRLTVTVGNTHECKIVIVVLLIIWVNCGCILFCTKLYRIDKSFICKIFLKKHYKQIITCVMISLTYLFMSYVCDDNLSLSIHVCDDSLKLSIHIS